MDERLTPVRYLTVIALLMRLFGGVVSAHAQGMTVQLGGPLYECRPGWDFAAGSVQAHFSAGYLVGPASQPPRFEAANFCGNSRVRMSLNAWVKNVQMRGIHRSVCSAGLSGRRIGQPWRERQDRHRTRTHDIH